MENKENFFKLLDSIQVSNTCNVEDAKKQFSLLQNWILLNLPERLFKFFGPKNRNFEAVENDEIWGSTIDEFNDPYESLPYYSMERCEQELVNKISLDTLSNFVSSFKQGTIPNDIKSLAPRDFVDNISAFCSDLQIDDSYVVNIDSIRTQIQCWLKNNSHALISDSYANLYLSQRIRHIACFTEERDTTLMWGHYGGGHKGFCVEYDFTKILNKCNENCTDIRACPQFMLNLAIAPVRYVEKRFDATPFLATVIMDSIIKQIGLPVSSFHSDTLIATKCLLAKSIDWSYEKEWRMLSMPNDVSGEKHKVIAKVQASAVYMGAHTSDETRSRLSKICAEKGIPCYLMIQKYSNNEFNVDPVLYNEYLQWVGKQHELSLELEK